MKTGKTLQENFFAQTWGDNFLADIGLRPSPRHSLHRIDGDGHYTASNCVWAPTKTQGRNTRRIKLTEEIAAEIRREDYMIPIAVLARAYGVSCDCVTAVLRGDNWA
jgi:hypothetical protein